MTRATGRRSAGSLATSARRARVRAGVRRRCALSAFLAAAVHRVSAVAHRTTAARLRRAADAGISFRLSAGGEGSLVLIPFPSYLRPRPAAVLRCVEEGE